MKELQRGLRLGESVPHGAKGERLGEKIGDFPPGPAEDPQVALDEIESHGEDVARVVAEEHEVSPRRLEEGSGLFVLAETEQDPAAFRGWREAAALESLEGSVQAFW